MIFVNYENEVVYDALNLIWHFICSIINRPIGYRTERPYSFTGIDLSFSKYSLAFSFVCVVHATAPGTNDKQHRGACCGLDVSL